MVVEPYPEPLSRRLARKHRRLIRFVVERDGRCCRTCGSDETGFCPYDHVSISLTVALTHPHRLGGRVVAGNLRTICCTCAAGFRELGQVKLPVPPRRLPR